MKKLFIVVLTVALPLCLSAQPKYNPLAVDLTRVLVKDLFASNAVEYVQPMVTTINAVSNSRFYDRAYIPKEDKLYFKVSVNGMYGTVRDDQRTFVPSINLGTPSPNLLTSVAQFGTFDITKGTFSINPTYEDTLGLVSLLLKETLLETQKQGRLPTPPKAATLFGYMPDVRFYIPPSDTLIDALRQRSDYQAIAQLSPSVDSALVSLLDSLSLPPYLTLPPGVNMNSLIAAVPQFEIGSLWGTELLLRFIPPVEFDKNVGKFSFYGVGLKHSVSQYFPERYFDAAIQAVYQRTSLTNTIGVTESSLEATANIFSANIQVSKELFEFLDVYSGLSYEQIDVTSTYTYLLPQEVQISLGLLPKPLNEGEKPVPTAEQPGDNRPQQSIVNSGDTNVKWTIGASAKLGDFRLAIDYNVSRFNILSAGFSFRF